MNEVGLGGVARFHNLPPGHHGLYDLRAIQAAIGGPVGIDAYTARRDFPELRRRTAALAGNATPIPLALEVGVGFVPWLPPLDPLDVTPEAVAARERDQLLTMLAGGVRGFNLFMAVERDRFHGAAIARDGHREAQAAWIAPLLAALAEIDWPSLRRTPAPAIAVIDCKADARFGVATSQLDPMTAVLTEALDLGPGGGAELGDDVGAIAAQRWQTAVCRALDVAQVGYAIVAETAGEDELAGYRAVIAPTIDRIDAGLARRLHAIAEQRRAVVVIGPGTPTRDELDGPLAEPLPRRVGRLRAASLDDLPGLADDLAKLAGPVDDAWHVERGDEVRVVAFAPPGGRVRAVFATCDASRPVTAIVHGDAAALRDAVTGERVAVTGGRATIAMPAGGVRMFIATDR